MEPHAHTSESGKTPLSQEVLRMPSVRTSPAPTITLAGVSTAVSMLDVNVNSVHESREERAEHTDVHGQVSLGLGLAPLVVGRPIAAEKAAVA
jgi:hypothetical protein